jgi:hypothetical protein
MKQERSERVLGQIFRPVGVMSKNIVSSDVKKKGNAVSAAQS